MDQPTTRFYVNFDLKQWAEGVEHLLSKILAHSDLSSRFIEVKVPGPLANYRCDNCVFFFEGLDEDSQAYFGFDGLF